MPDPHPPTRTASLNDWARLIARPTIAPGGGSAAAAAGVLAAAVVEMVAALTEKGYDVNFVWGIGTHSNKQGGAMLPEMLRWLWRDYPRPDDARDTSNRTLFVPGEAAP